MLGPSVIVAERGETDKKVSADEGGFSLRNFAAWRLGVNPCCRWKSLTQRRKAVKERKVRRLTALRIMYSLFALVLPCSQMLHELSHDETNTGQQKRVDESTLLHHELQDKPGDEEK